VNAVYSDGSTAQIAAGWTLAWNDASLEEGSTAITAETGTKTVAVAYGGKTASFTISVNDSVYTISGTITTSDGASALGATGQLKQGVVSIGSAVSADLNGIFIITGVPAGTYTIDVSLAGYVPGTIAAFAVSNANITGKDLVLQKTSDGDTTSPAEVTGLIGTPGDGTVTLTWTDPADDDLDHLEITWTGGGVTTTKSAAADRANSKAVTGLTNGTTYAFTVKAVDASGTTSHGETASATPSGGTNPPEDTTPPAEVTSLIGTPGDGTVTLTWTDPADSDLGHLEISWTGGSATAEKSTAGDRSNSKTISGLINGIAYVFTIKAVDASGNESQGGTVSATPGDTTPPAEVTGLIGTPSDGAVTLTWTDPADGDLDHIEISWTGGSVTVEKSTAEDRSNSKTIDGLTNRIAYAFTVKAVDASGNESQGETVSATPIDISTGTAITIASAEDWTNALRQINTGGNGTISDPKVYTLDIQGIVSVGGSSENTINGNYKIVRLTGTGTLSLSSGGSIFRLNNNNSSSNQTLIIDGPILTGRTNNSAPLVLVQHNTVELWNGTISDNTTTTSSGGGGVFISNNGTFIMSGGTISNNTSPGGGGGGGGVSVGNYGTFIMSGGTISNNTSTGDGGSGHGGGVYVGNGTFTMSGGTISNNTSSGSGGGVGVSNNVTFTMSGGIISGNTAGRDGGGVNFSSSRTFTMLEGTINGNTAGNDGGGVYFSSSGTFTMSEGTISDNNTARNGGGVYFGNGTFTMSGGIISGNTAGVGGGIFSYGTFTKTGGIIYGDTDHIVGNGNATDNTAISTSNPGTNGHAVLYIKSSVNYYRNETLADDASGNISTTDTLPAESGDVLNNWTKR
jgi:hypothetical protein